MPGKRWSLITILMSVFATLGLIVSASAETLSVKPGWDLTPKLQKGYVIYSLSEQRGCALRLDITYISVALSHIILSWTPVFDAKGPDGDSWSAALTFAPPP